MTEKNGLLVITKNAALYLQASAIRIGKKKLEILGEECV